MSQANQALQVALAAAEQLPLEQRRELVEQVLVTTAAEEQVAVYLQRLPMATQARFQDLMDKSNEGTLTRAERKELERLVDRANDIMMENSKALARAVRPDLFDEQGEPIKSRMRAALQREPPPRKRKASRR